MIKYIEYINLIEKRIEELTSFDSSLTYNTLCEAERYSMLAGGKHLRGLILLKTAELFGTSAEKAIDFACALEMVHTYSLVHDDLPEMDNDDLRRGKPTCHKKFGTDIALLAGDALLTKAFYIISKNNEYDDSKKIECIRILAACCGEHGMLAGQIIDKQGESKPLSESELYELHSRKTGDMFLAAVKIGAVLGNAKKADKDLAEELISVLGLAFQIKDDILDVTSTADVLGKPINSDLDSNKSTFVSLFGLERSKEILDEKIKQARGLSQELDCDFFNDLTNYFANRNM